MNVYIVQVWALALTAFAVGSLVAWFTAALTLKPIERVREELASSVRPTARTESVRS